MVCVLIRHCGCPVAGSEDRVPAVLANHGIGGPAANTLVTINWLGLSTQL